MLFDREADRTWYWRFSGVCSGYAVLRSCSIVWGCSSWLHTKGLKPGHARWMEMHKQISKWLYGHVWVCIIIGSFKLCQAWVEIAVHYDQPMGNWVAGELSSGGESGRQSGLPMWWNPCIWYQADWAYQCNFLTSSPILHHQCVSRWMDPFLGLWICFSVKCWWLKWLSLNQWAFLDAWPMASWNWKIVQSNLIIMNCSVECCKISRTAQ